MKTNEKATQVFCDDSVMESGWGVCGVFIRDHDPVTSEWVDAEYLYSLSDNISSTQAELCAVLCGLRTERGKGSCTLLWWQ